jgi:hypothetical protein
MERLGASPAVSFLLVVKEPASFPRPLYGCPCARMAGGRGGPSLAPNRKTDIILRDRIFGRAFGAQPHEIDPA